MASVFNTQARGLLRPQKMPSGMSRPPMNMAHQTMTGFSSPIIPKTMSIPAQQTNDLVRITPETVPVRFLSFWTGWC